MTHRCPDRTPKEMAAELRLERALKRWDREWGEVARNDPYAAPWDRQLGNAIMALRKARRAP